MKTYYIFIQGELFHGWTDSEYIAIQYINIDKYCKVWYNIFVQLPMK